MNVYLKGLIALINIGNGDSDMVPSKLFEYFSLGKPIIHFYQSDNDSCLSYLEKYPLSCIIKMDERYLTENIKKISEFLVKNKDKVLNIEQIKKIFPMNCPEYTAEIIKKTLPLK